MAGAGAVPGGTFTGYAAVGEREDLADIIYDISPTDTNFLSNIPRESGSAVFHEWQTDTLAAATSGNAQLEGDDYNADTATPTKRFGNYMQISAKVPRVTGTLRAVNTAGRADEYSYQILKRGRELKRDMEAALLSLNAATAGAAASARVMAGVASWLFTNQVQKGDTATTTTVTSGAPTTAPTAGTAGAFTSADLKTAIKSCWDQGGAPDLVLLGSANKQTASGFTGIATLYRDTPPSAPATIIGAADVYVSDFGQHQIVANRFMPADNVYVLDMEYWAMATLRDIQEEPLSKTGDSDRTLLIAEYTLVARNPDSSAKIYTTT